MRIVLFVLLSLFIVAPSFGQVETVETYLIVRIKKQDNRRPENIYYTIEAEPHNVNALDIYDLVPFNREYFVKKPGVEFYNNHPDTATLYYNYFKSETEALDFIGSQKWQLVTVVPEISSGYRESGNMPFTTISSQLLYYFRKTVIPLSSLKTGN